MGQRAFELAFETAPVEDIQQWINIGARLQVADARARNSELAFEAFIFGQK
jgi:hypothetical protein